MYKLSILLMFLFIPVIATAGASEDPEFRKFMEKSIGRHQLYTHNGLLFKIDTAIGYVELLQPEFGVFVNIYDSQRANKIFKDPKRAEQYEALVQVPLLLTAPKDIMRTFIRKEEKAKAIKNNQKQE